jgi:hypothetical protein
MPDGVRRNHSPAGSCSMRRQKREEIQLFAVRDWRFEGAEGRNGRMPSAPTFWADQRVWAALRARLLRCWGEVRKGISEN